MDYGLLLGGLHQLVNLLLYPVIVALGLLLVLILWELGLSLAERLITLKVYREQIEFTQEHSDTFNDETFKRREKLAKDFRVYATKRLERVDLFARSGPILGLMGTLIPLGPGLTALGEGNLDILATALAVAFDTTVLGLLIGLVAYILGRVRRRWYEDTWQVIDEILARSTNLRLVSTVKDHHAVANVKAGSE